MCKKYFANRYFGWLRYLFFIYRALVGLIDEEIDNRLNLANIKAEPLNPVVH